MDVPTLRVKSSHPSQGDHVIINESDFDPAVHELFDAPPPPPPPPSFPPLPAAQPDPLAGLPKDWATTFKTAQLRALAETVSGRAVENREQAIQVIRNALKGS